MQTLLNAKRYPCPVCCCCFGRDGDMILVDGSYVCLSEFWNEDGCGFSFPEGLTKEEIEKAAKEKIINLQRRR